MLYMTHDEVEVSWRGSLVNGPVRSRHFYLAVIFNLLNAVAISHLFLLFRYSTEMVSRMLVLLPAVVGVLAFSGYYMFQMYRLMNSKLKDTSEASVLLQISYIAFRLYLLTLGISFVILAGIPLVVGGY